MKPNRRAFFNRIAGLALGLNTTLLDCGTRTLIASASPPQGFEAEFPSMGSKINLRWYCDHADHADQDRIVEAARTIADHWTSVLSDYDPTSQVMVACLKGDEGNWVPLSNDLWNVVQRCEQWHRWSNGAFDAALGAITRLRRRRMLATPVQWEEARRASGWGLVEFDVPNQAIRFQTPSVRFDFGAIGKGFVVDRIAEKLLEMEIERFVVNASGNMRIGQSPPQIEGWPIAIDVPATGANEATTELLRTRIRPCGIATSGDRWQRFPDGVGVAKNQYSSHIVDPSTHTGVSGHQSVTVIADDAADADAAATATCVRARRDLAGWLETLSEQKPKLQAMVLLKDEATANVRMISTGVDTLGQNMRLGR